LLILDVDGRRDGAKVLDGAYAFAREFIAGFDGGRGW